MMKIDREDVEWLQRLLLEPRAEIPPFNRSRLLTLGLVDELELALRITSRGHEAIAEHHRKRL